MEQVTDTFGFFTLRAAWAVNGSERSADRNSHLDIVDGGSCGRDEQCTVQYRAGCDLEQTPADTSLGARA